MTDSFYVTLLVIAALLQVGDAWTTIYVLKRGGYERNKYLLRVREWIASQPRGGPWLWLALKTAFVYAALLLQAAWYWHVSEQRVLATWVLCVLVAIYGYVVLVHNAEAVRRLGRK